MKLSEFLDQIDKQRIHDDMLKNTASQLRQETYESFCRRKMTESSSLPAPTSDAEVVDIITGHLLPNDWYIVYSVGREIANTEIVAYILREYPRRAKQHGDWWAIIKMGVKKLWQNIFS